MCRIVRWLRSADFTDTRYIITGEREGGTHRVCALSAGSNRHMSPRHPIMPSKTWVTPLGVSAAGGARWRGKGEWNAASAASPLTFGPRASLDHGILRGEHTLDGEIDAWPRRIYEYTKSSCCNATAPSKRVFPRNNSPPVASTCSCIGSNFNMKIVSGRNKEPG